MLEKTKEAFAGLGSFLNAYISAKNSKVVSQTVKAKFDTLAQAVKLSNQQNQWFTEENIDNALAYWASKLTLTELNRWLKPYHFAATSHKTVAIIMAGNIPLVGFHDMLCVLSAGFKVQIKLSSNDRTLLPFLVTVLVENYPELKSRIEFVERLKNFDLVIATGSDNTARYFEFYFKNKPHIIRKNRHSFAVLKGDESPEMLKNLGKDIFTYFGLGCRNVSKIYVPKEFAFHFFFDAIESFEPLIHHHKYNNNYTYNRTVYLLNSETFLDNGFLILKNDSSTTSPLATVFYETYDDLETLKIQLKQAEAEIQCVVSDDFIEGEIAFGQTQNPALNDYADGVDTMLFLSKYNN